MHAGVYGGLVVKDYQQSRVASSASRVRVESDLEVGSAERQGSF